MENWIQSAMALRAIGKALEALAVDALLLERTGSSLQYVVVLRTVRHDKRLFQSIASHQSDVLASGENHSIIAP